MERLYTEKEKTRYLNVLCIFIFLGAVAIDIFYYGINSLFIQDFVLFFIIFIFVELVLLIIWYPSEYMKRIALKKGNMYCAKIKDIKVRDRKGISLVRQTYTYTIIFECEIDGQIKIWEQGNYVDNPREYIPNDYKCKAYFYRKKVYVEDFFKNISRHKQESYEQDYMNVLYGKFDNKEINSVLKYSIEEIPFVNKNQLWEAVEERETYWMINSKRYIIVRPVFFMCPIPYKVVFVEVHIRSRKFHRAIDFSLFEKISQYVNTIATKTDLSKEEHIYNITKIVHNEIVSKDKKIDIEQIYVVIR